MQDLPGAIVVARGRRQLVLDVARHIDCESVRLAPITPGGAPLTLLRPFDEMHPVPARRAPRRAGRRSVARAAAAAVRGAHAAGELWSAADARIRILPYQLEPALAVVRGEASRVLLADEVGLGKTVQAGLILTELRARNALVRALILVPAGLRDQWALELRERFGLDVARMDAARLAGLQQTLPPWINAWTLPGIALVSIDLLKRDELLPQLEYVLWDAVVVDEAHHAAPGTERHAAAALACRRARVVILVTATPHDGRQSLFATLRGIGALEGDIGPLRVFRRTRADVDTASPPRRTRLVTVSPDPPETELHRLLSAYTERVWRETLASSDARLAMIVLRKRALSGAASIARSLARRIAALASQDVRPLPSQLALAFADSADEDLTADDEEPVAGLGAPGLADRESEREILERLLQTARAAIPCDSKAAALERALARTREPVIIFTEYRDTLEDLRRRLVSRLHVAVLHGGLLPAERQEALAAFASGRARLLLATDAAAEGLNLHERCRWVVHVEAPWSPVRIEQRNGRVDRLGQARRVHVWHLIAGGSEEARVLARLAARSALAARELADEAAVARAVFEGFEGFEGFERFEGFEGFEGFAGVRVLRDSAEAMRIATIRRLPAAPIAATAPLAAFVKRRGPFGTFARGELLAVFRAQIFDAGGQRIATLTCAVRARDAKTARRAANRCLGRRARASVAVDRRARARAAGRDRAIESAVADSRTGALQPSLFDRRAVAAAEHRSTACLHALDEIARRRQAREGAAAYRVAISLVAAFVAR